MTREDINDIINAICPNDEDYEKPCISPKYLRQELEQLALDQRQWNGEPTTKNDLGVDCISRERALEPYKILKNTDTLSVYTIRQNLAELPSVTPQEPQSFKWCTDCKEYDQEKHCCHRWSKVIRNTVEEMKQEYIEREVLDNIRAEMEEIHLIGYATVDGKREIASRAVIQIIDKYKAESEE